MRRQSLIAVLIMAGLGAGTSSAPLIDVVKSQDEAAVRALLARGAGRVNATETDGSTALHWAVYRDSLDMVDRLLRAGATATVANRYGATPLSLAATNGNAAIIARLLKAGADANAALPGGETALMTAARTGNVDAIRVLLAHGAHVNAKESLRGQTPLMWAAAEGHAAAITVLVESGADVHAASHGPSTPPEITSGLSVFRRGIARVDSMTPLLFAVRAGHREAVSALLAAGADVNEVTTTGMSALVLAIVNAHYELASMLLDRGANPNAAKQGWTALHQVVRTRTLNIGQFPHPVPTGSMSSVDLAKKLLEKGATLDATMTKAFNDEYRGFFNYVGATPYLVAAKGGDAELMKLFGDRGANPAVANAKGTTALMAAAGVEMFNPAEDSGTNEDGLACVRLALAFGADVNTVNKDGDTALHGAAYRGSNEIAQLLINKGAKLDVKNGRGFTPLRIANGEQLALVNIQKRPETVALLRKAMLDRGLAPEMKSDQEQYSFGVPVK